MILQVWSTDHLYLSHLDAQSESSEMSLLFWISASFLCYIFVYSRLSISSLMQDPVALEQAPCQGLAERSLPTTKQAALLLSSKPPAGPPGFSCWWHRLDASRYSKAQRLMRHLIHISWLLFDLLCLWDTQWKRGINRKISEAPDN